ncbi:MAG: nucleotidyltransferase substrate binding protein [Nitrospinae bacterium]|nr:nucleotidyltransferase substrate binding protein [Nitrospinota bacterium]
MSIDYSSLGKAINRLEKSIQYADSPTAKVDPGLFEQLRNSVIQCFEFTYELSHKLLKRYLEETSASPDEFDLGVFQNLIRIGNEKGMLRSDWPRWKAYRQARADSSHAYDEDKADAVYQIAHDFLIEAGHLYKKLTERSGRES